jgi:hypothetical protein
MRTGSKSRLSINFETEKIMKEVSLNIGERIVLINIFNQVKNDIVTLRAVLEDSKDIAVGEEEGKEINLRNVYFNKETGVEVTLDEAKSLEAEGKQVASQIKWDSSTEKVASLSAESVKCVLDFIKTKSEAKELTLADVVILSLEEKLSN